MTAEVAIINRFGIALAADSAVTIGDERVWKTTNKLFSLGPNHDVGLMIYGGGTYLGCPWDTVIKEYRESINGQQFTHVSEVVTSFMDFLLQPRWGTDEEDTRHAAEHTAGEYVGHVLEELGSVGQKDSRAEEIQKM